MLSIYLAYSIFRHSIYLAYNTTKEYLGKKKIKRKDKIKKTKKFSEKIRLRAGVGGVS